MKKFLSSLKPYLPLLSLIPIGVLITASVWRTKHWIAFPIGLIGMLMVIVGLLGTAKLMERKMEEEDPYFFDDPIRELPWEKYLHIGAPMFMIFGLFGIGLLRPYTNNLINEVFFALVCAVAGATVASVIVRWLQKRYPALKPTNETRSKEVACLWVGIGFFTAIGIICLNFFLEPRMQVQKKVAMLEHGASRQKPEAYIWVNYDGERMELRPNRNSFNQLIGQDSVLLTISTGPLGFEYTCEMAKGDN